MDNSEILRAYNRLLDTRTGALSYDRRKFLDDNSAVDLVLDGQNSGDSILFSRQEPGDYFLFGEIILPSAGLNILAPGVGMAYEVTLSSGHAAGFRVKEPALCEMYGSKYKLTKKGRIAPIE